MSVFDTLKPTLLDVVHDAHVMKEDHKLLTTYNKQIEGVGLESLEKSPAHQLIEQSLIQRYGSHMKVGAGNEGLTLLGAAVLAGGYMAYKKFMRAKNNPILKNTADVEKNINDTYTPAWLEGKKSVEKDVGCGELSKFFAGNDFGAMSGKISTTVNDKTKEVIGVINEATGIWSSVKSDVEAWCRAKDDDVRKAIVEKLQKKYPASPYNDLLAKISSSIRSGKGGKLPALTEAQYPQAVALLKVAVAGFEKIDTASESMWLDLGFWELFDDVPHGAYGDDYMWDLGYSENINDFFGRPIWSMREYLLDISRGLETWIVNSFK